MATTSGRRGAALLGAAVFAVGTLGLAEAGGASTEPTGPASSATPEAPAPWVASTAPGGQVVVLVEQTGSVEIIGPVLSPWDDCFGNPLSFLTTIYVPEGSTGWTHGTPGDDVIMGTHGPDKIDGEGGNDVICAFAGDDIIFGGPGNDDIEANAGDDYVQAEENIDWISGGKGSDTIDGGDQADGIFGGDGEDHLYGGSGDDNVYGQDDDDEVQCGSDVDYGMGNEGHDWHNDCETWWTDDWPGPE